MPLLSPRLPPEKPSTDSNATYAVSAASGIRQVHDGNKAVDTRNFAGERPYLEKGKSQKFLNRKNTPLTIEQVRELLNKNK